MTYLLDVNTLIAFGLFQHEFHERVVRWVNTLPSSVEDLATCPITELGFIRVLAQTPQYGSSVAQARTLLLRVKQRMAFVADDRDISNLPKWVKTAKQTTDGHLLELARANGATLATLDTRIPGALLIA